MRIVRFVLAFLTLAVVLGAGAASAMAYPPAIRGQATINATVFAPGADAVITVQHTTPGPITSQIFSAPVVLGHGTVGADGTGTVSGRIPAGYSGPHTIQAIGAGGEIYTFNVTITSSGSGGSGSGGGTLASTGAQVALGTGVGLAALLAGGFLLVVSRRRSAQQA